jgi:transcriptional regulator with XRE-family HTH domain
MPVSQALAPDAKLPRDAATSLIQAPVMLYVAIAEIRGSKGWSQGELAKRAGVTRATVNRLENGHPRSIDLVVLEKLAKALGVEKPGLLIQPIKDRGGRG